MLVTVLGQSVLLMPDTLCSVPTVASDSRHMCFRCNPVWWNCTGMEIMAIENILLSVRNLTVSFGERTVIRDLTFEVRRGDTLAIIGPNGSGKSVLLKTLLGLVPHTGAIDWAPGVRLGYVPQKLAADRQLPLVVRNLLEVKAGLLKLSPKDVSETVDLLGLSPEIINSGVGLISGGQFQKVLLAMALVGKPNVLLFDEPTASLDELEEERIYELMGNLQKSQHLTMLLVSHDLSIVHRSANLVLCLSRGGNCVGSPDKVLTQEVLEAAYSAPLQYYKHIDSHHDGRP
jgi:zinc transport system ATP-binding protein